MDRANRPQLSPASVTEQNMPGIGRRYDVATSDGGEVTVVLHHSGRRDLYVRQAGQADAHASVALTDAQARALGAVVAGAYFKPAVVEEVEAVVGELLIDWVTLRTDSPGAGRSIADLEIRRRTGMTVAAVIRDDEAIVAPEPTEVLMAGDRLVVLGRPDDLARLTTEVVG